MGAPHDAGEPPKPPDLAAAEREDFDGARVVDEEESTGMVTEAVDAPLETPVADLLDQLRPVPLDDDHER